MGRPSWDFVFALEGPSVRCTLSWTQGYDDHDAAQAGRGDRAAWPGYPGHRASQRETERLQGKQAGRVDRHGPREQMLRSGLPDERVKAERVHAARARAGEPR